jgi:hypothetical protein
LTIHLKILVHLILVHSRNLTQELVLFGVVPHQLFNVINIVITLLLKKIFVFIHRLLQSLEIAIVTKATWELLHQLFKHVVRGSLARDQVVYLDVQSQEEFILFDDLLELSLIYAQLLHFLVL